MSIKNPVYTIGKKELGELLETYFRKLELSGYDSFFPDIDTLRIVNGQHDEFQSLSIELKYKELKPKS